jgi:segregation and condensation protein A
MDNFIADPQKPQEKIFSLLFNEDELTWQNIIYDLVRQEGMDPWDIDVTEIAQKFLEMLKKLKEMDFRISGKVVLAAALLLKIKSHRLVDEDITALDSIMSSADEPESLLDELTADDGQPQERVRGNTPRLMPKTPQPRQRKVSVEDLVKALEKALEVEVRRPPVYQPPKVQVKLSHKSIDVAEMINDVYVKVQGYYQTSGENSKTLTFSQLIPSDSKDDKVYTFIPLLHLENQRKVDMKQEAHFGEIDIALAKPKPVEVTVEVPKEAENVKKSKPRKAKKEAAPEVKPEPVQNQDPSAQ